MAMNRIIRFVTMLFIIAANITGCDRKQNPSISHTPEIQNKAEKQKITPSETSTASTQTRATITQSVTPTITVTPTQMIMTETITPTSTNTSTPFPNLTAQEAEKVIAEYLQTNGGCMECFWGIVPGKYTVEETREFLKSINLS